MCSVELEGGVWSATCKIKVWGAKCKVLRAERGVWSAKLRGSECRVWSAEHGVQSIVGSAEDTDVDVADGGGGVVN